MLGQATYEHRACTAEALTHRLWTDPADLSGLRVAETFDRDKQQGLPVGHWKRGERQRQPALALSGFKHIEGRR